MFIRYCIRLPRPFTAMDTGTMRGRRPSSPEIADVKSDVTEPSHSPLAEILNEVDRLGSNATTEARVKGNSVDPKERNRWPNAYTRLPSM